MSDTPARVLYVAEPPALWRLRPPVVVDCSALAAMLFAEPEAEAAAAMLVERRLHAPSLLPYEIANVARGKLRSGAQADAVQAALGEFAELRIEIHPAPARQLLALASQYSLSAYDAAYLWLAGELQAPLATFDRRLAEAAQRHLGL
jgi:predicted nucleic acid-binding protein